MKSLLTGVLLCLATIGCAYAGSSYTNLADAYTALGFDPNVPGNAVVVMFSDPHLTIYPGLETVTNLDSRLVNSVNAMSPPAAKIMVSGDICFSYSTVPGFLPGGDWYLRQGTNEMLAWKSAIQAITNVAPADFLWVPGNHDQDPRETNAEMFCRIFTNMPTCQSLEVAGTRFLIVNGGNCNEPSTEQKLWLKQKMAATSPTQTVVAVIHQPPFGSAASERGGGLMFRDAFRDWPAPWWIVAGHAHISGTAVFDVGQQNVAVSYLGTVNTNQANGMTYHAGYLLLCLSNGISGRIYYHFNDGTYETLGAPDWQHPNHWQPAFENIQGLLWHRMKTPARPPEVTLGLSYIDCGYWWLSPFQVQWTLNLQRHNNQATHFLILGDLAGDSTVFFSSNRLNWFSVPLPTPTNQVYSFVLPPVIANLPVAYVRYFSSYGENDIGGYGLSTTSPPPWTTFPMAHNIPEQRVPPGITLVVTNLAEDPYAPPDNLTYTLLNGPDGASIDPATGVFTWRPDSAQQPETVSALVKVADNGNPQMSALVPFQITVPPQYAALVIEHPRSQAATIGNDVAFTVSAIGDNPLFYQWFFNENAIQDATNSLLVISNAQRLDAGSYSVMVSNFVGFDTSMPANLLVGLPPVITSQPNSQNAPRGATVRFQVLLGGDPSTLQWFRSGQPLLGQTNSTIVISPSQIGNGGAFFVIATNDFGSVTSSIASLLVRDAATPFVIVFGDSQPIPSNQAVFVGSVIISLVSSFSGGSIFYTLDGSSPGLLSTPFSGTFIITNSTTLRVVAFTSDLAQSGELNPIQILVAPLYSLSATSTGGGHVTFQIPPGPCDTNTFATATAVPDNGWTFLYWLGDASGTNAITSILMNRDRLVQPVFGTPINTGINGAGTISLYPRSTLFPFGTTVRMTARPQPGNYFSQWDGALAGNTNPSDLIVTNADPIILATFSTLDDGQAAFTVESVGFGKTFLTPSSNTFPFGASVTLEADPDPYQSFVGWSGDAAGTDTPLSVVLDQSKTIVATYTTRPSLVLVPGFDGLSSDGFRFTLFSEFGLTTRIDNSTNLSDWQTLAFLTNQYGKIEFTDPAALVNANSFYRAVQLP